ncbi:hypothetical protein [Candidatus Entotheonella palauensis]|uniref:hypothetical protein n=1 Tax=Candidatus Entotheonella palauensis TaxID=93172 RepID=UPI000B7D98EF|nr:hypothetical protein [Candidatus Entotheonella palauensis]
MVNPALKTIGVREFREKLAQHLTLGTPLAITRNGITIGYYIPARRPIADEDRQALTDATQRLHELLEAKGIDPEELIEDFKKLRKSRKKSHG